MSRANKHAAALLKKKAKPSKPAMLAANAEADSLRAAMDRTLADIHTAIRYIAAGEGAAAKSMLQKICDDHDDVAIKAEEARGGMPALPVVLPDAVKLQRAQKRFDKMVAEYQIPIAMIGWIPSINQPGSYNMTANGERRAIAMLQRFLDSKGLNSGGPPEPGSIPQAEESPAGPPPLILPG